MKAFKYIYILLVAFSLNSCFKDETEEATRALAEIVIQEGSINSIYNIEKNEVLTISPIIEQKNESKPLSYTWEIDLKVYSHDDVFVYEGSELGSFNCRLIVSNDDGKTFFPFKLHVNSPYEEGVTVLSKDTQGRPMLSFMQTPLNSTDVAVFTNYDCLEKNNEDVFFASNPTDIVQTTGSLVISCAGTDAADDASTIYFMNEKTLVVENIVSGAEYSGFKPTKLLIPSQGYDGISYPVLSADGKIYELPTSNAILQPSTKLFGTYSQVGFVADNGSATSYDVLLWNKELKALSLIYNGYGPYYCGSKYLLQENDENFVESNYFNGFDIVTMVPINKTAEQKKISSNEMLVLVKGSMNLQKVVLSTFFWQPIEGSPGDYTVLDNGGLKITGAGKSPIDDNTPCIANKTYNSLLFADGNKVRRWNYTTNQQIGKSDVLQTIGSENAIITSFEISADHKKTYVAFYEPEQEGLNGSVWVIDTDNGEILERYNNICYQPVKVFYKEK